MLVLYFLDTCKPLFMARKNASKLKPRPDFPLTPPRLRPLAEDPQGQASLVRPAGRSRGSRGPLPPRLAVHRQGPPPPTDAGRGRKCRVHDTSGRNQPVPRAEGRPAGDRRAVRPDVPRLRHDLETGPRGRGWHSGHRVDRRGGLRADPQAPGTGPGANLAGQPRHPRPPRSSSSPSTTASARRPFGTGSGSASPRPSPCGWRSASGQTRRSPRRSAGG